MIFYYIRHGQPIYNPDSLTELGQKQAQALSRRLAIGGLDKIYSSSSNRAVMTAMPTAEALGLDIEQLPWAHESLVWNEFCGKLPDGRHTWCFYDKEILAQFNLPEVRALGDSWMDHPAFTGTTAKYREGFARVGSECDRLFESLGFIHDVDQHYYRIKEPKYERVAFFAHAGFGMEFLSYILDIPYPLFCTRFENHSQTGMTVILFPQEGDISVPRILEYSNDSHLYKEDLEPFHHAARF